MDGSRIGRGLLLALAWAGALVFAFLSYDLVAGTLGFGVDSHAYWAAWRGPLYDNAPATRDAYLYSPAFAQVLWPLVQVPWPVFAVAWSAAAAATVLWLAAGAGARWAGPLALLGTLEVLTGNINWLIALAVVLGLRHPGAWAVVALTKITPALGPVWFLARGEWRRLGLATAWTLTVVAASVATAPDLWREWLSFLTTHASSSTGRVGSAALPPLTVRAPLAVLLVAWGARTNRTWVLPVAMAIASPVGGLGQLVVLLAIPRLRDVGPPSRKDQLSASQAPRGAAARSRTPRAGSGRSGAARPPRPATRSPARRPAAGR